MKVVIVNAFDTYEERVELVHEFFRIQGHDVTIIQSDFRHIKKTHRKDLKEDFNFIRSIPYYKNLSIVRAYSHYKYARDALKIVEDTMPDLLYVLIPPNSLAKFASEYKQKYKEVKLIFDIIDLWPESMPISKGKSLFPFSMWKTMRDKSFKNVDLVITECDLYQTVLEKPLKDIKTETVYLAKKEIDVVSNPQLSEDEIHLAYLGSINNIIDIPRIKEIIEVINAFKPVTLHIIGDGENKQGLIDSAQAAGAIVEYHGKVYDPQQKQDIFDKCHFGLNIMKESVCVGLTMKSIDYFQHGLPIINNIPADTTDILEKYGAGLNINNMDKFRDSISYILEDTSIKKRIEASIVFENLFSQNAFLSKLMLLIQIGK